MALTTFLVNNVPVESYGLAVANTSKGWLGATKRTYQALPVPLRQGQVPVSQGSMTDPRVMTLEFSVAPSSFSDRRAKLNAIYQAMVGRLEIVSVEDPTKACYGYLTNGPTGFQGIGLVSWDVQMMPEITCWDPLWYDLNPQSVTIAAPNVPYVVPVGTEASWRWNVVINGPVTNPILILKNRAGIELQRQTLSCGTLASTASIVVDHGSSLDNIGRFTVTQWIGGVATSQLGWLGTTETFMLLDPHDAPTIEVDVGSGTATGVAYAWRAYTS